MEPTTFAAFADRLIQEQMARNRIPGAVLVVVRDGRVFFARGYGYADLERKRLWDPERTVFRARSVSKVVTATAVMQLHERGLLDLDADLRPLLPPTMAQHRLDQPLTAAHLLTHTGGMADRGVATGVRDPADLMPLEAYLALDRYPQVSPPGERAGYGDHGPTVLAHVVERVTGQPFPAYAREHIFRPLGMERSTFEQPYPDALARELAVGYIDLFGRSVPQRGGYSQVYPANGMLTTAADMGRLMLAHLQEGRLGSGRILRPETVREMQRRHFTHHPALPGLTYGFWEASAHGRRALLHYGEGLGFASLLYLLPEEGTGIFLATNRRDFRLHHAFVEAFLDQYFPADALSPEPLAGQRDRAPRFAGVYQFLRHDPRMMEKVNVEEVVIRANPDGTLSASFAEGRWVEVEPLLFRQVDGEGQMAFQADSRGRITDLFVDHWPWAFRRVQWYDALGFRLPLLAASVFLFLSVPVVWTPWRSLLHRRRTLRVRRRWGGPDWARLTAGVVSLLNLLFVALLAPTLIVTSQGGDAAVAYGLPPYMVAGLLIPMLTLPLTVALLIFAGAAWKGRYWTIPGRVHYTLVAAAAAAFVWSLAYLNLLGFHV